VLTSIAIAASAVFMFSWSSARRMELVFFPAQRNTRAGKNFPTTRRWQTNQRRMYTQICVQKPGTVHYTRKRDVFKVYEIMGDYK